MLPEIFTHSLCSKPPPPSLVILWHKVLFFKTRISVVFSTVFLKEIENHKFSIFFSFLVPKTSHFFENGSKAILNEIKFWASKIIYKEICIKEHWLWSWGLVYTSISFSILRCTIAANLFSSDLETHKRYIFSAKESAEILGKLPLFSASYQLFLVLLNSHFKRNLRSTMGQDHLNHLALLSIERNYVNRVGIEKVIDEFSSKTGRSKFFFQPTFRPKNIGDIFWIL